MDVGRGAAGYDPLLSCPRCVNIVQVGRYVHRGRITRLPDEVWWTQIWHALSTFEHDVHFPPKGK
eukprot:4857019-Pyramimonas_sp.AAC.1